MRQAKRDKLNIKKLNPPGIFKKRKGNREFGEKFESKYLFNVNGSLKSNINDGITDALNNVDGLSL